MPEESERSGSATKPHVTASSAQGESASVSIDNGRIHFTGTSVLAVLAAVGAVLLSALYTLGVGGALLAVVEIGSQVLGFEWSPHEIPTWIRICLAVGLALIVMPLFMGSLFGSFLVRVTMVDLVTFRFSWSNSIRKVAKRLAAEQRGR